MSKNLYDALIKRRHIDQAGVFDGFTDAGGVPVLRGNLALDLNIPIYHVGEDGITMQLKLGEAHVGSEYLDRTIHYRGAFGGAIKKDPGVKQRPGYVDKSSLTIAFAHEGRDIIVDLKKGTVFDPTKPTAKLSDYKDINKMVESLTKRLAAEDGLSTYRDVWNELQESSYKGAQLAIMAMPSPRTGPHDAMVVKVKNILDARDGGVIELNSYDATMRAQRDMDTDKLPFYMDTPFSAMHEAYKQNGAVKEALPIPTLDRNTPDLDMYNNQSFKLYNQKIQTFKRLRGPILKMHRKLTYAKRLLDSIDGIDIGGGNRIVFTGDAKDAQQRLVNDSQNVLDIYDGTSDLLANINKWGDRTLFGNSHKDDVGVVNASVDKPFFQIRHTKDGKVGYSALSTQANRTIVKKVLNDFGRLLQLESSVYEAGEAKAPRYSDMVSEYRDFRSEYDMKSVDWNFYNYMVKSNLRGEANKLFFNNEQARIDAIKEGNATPNPIFGELARKIHDNPTPFLKSLHNVANKDHVKVRETYGHSGSDFFNNGIQKLIGKNRAETLEIFQKTGALTDLELDRKNNLINDLWNQFEAGREHEQMMVQANTIETELRRSERSLELEKKKRDPDESYVAIQEENILIKSEALKAMLNKMAVSPTEYGQDLRHFKIIKDNPKAQKKVNTINEEFKEITIRDKRTGDFKKGLKKGEQYTLKSNEVAVYNPIKLTPVVEHELIDGAAYAYSVLGRYSHILDTDMQEFRRVVNDTKKEIKKSARNMMKVKGYRDWSKHNSDTQAAIDNGIKRIKKLATRDVNDMIDSRDTWLGQMPRGRETYGEDFLMSLLLPDYGSNPNEFHYSPKTGNFMPAVGAPKASVINSVMRAIELYQVTPDFKGFVQDFAGTHRGFYEAIVAGRGFHEGLQRLNESNFESALLNTTIGKVMNNTFMPKKDYKTMDETFDAMPAILSDYAELYRQVLQEGALADPMTAFGLRKQILDEPSLGLDGYNRIFQQARGHVVLEGFTARQFGLTKGEGQVLGEVLMSRGDVKRRQITGSKKAEKGTEIIDFLDREVGKESRDKELCPN